MFKTVFFSGFVLIAVGQCFAGLDIDRLHDQTVAIYHFENNEDSGPRCLNLDFGDDTQITGAPESHLDIKIVKNGKIDKSVRLKGVGDIISYCEGLHFGLVDNEFSIVAWVNMPKQVNQFFIAMEAWGDDQTIHRVGKISLVVNNDGNLIGHIERRLTDTHISTNAWDNTEQNVANRKWHHIAFTQYANHLNLFVDGALVKREPFQEYAGFIGKNTLIRIGVHNTINQRILIDDLGFFETGFSLYEIKGLYNSPRGLRDFLEVMPVQPQDKISTTWADIKLF